MPQSSDILIFGTGNFGARILFDIAATAQYPTRVTVAGRKAERLAWLRTAGHARAAMFQRPVRIDTTIADVATPERAAEVIQRVKPKVIAQIASAQPAAVIYSQGNAWTKMVADGGLSATAVFQALLSSRVARGLKLTGLKAEMINCCYADVVNGLIAAQGAPISSGIGNVAILSNAFEGELGPGAKQLQMIAHYQTLANFRRPPTDRNGPVPRVWIGGEEIADVRERFAGVQLTPEPVIDISGASGVPLMVAMAAGKDWRGHAPGPFGLPGGYPVRLNAGKLDLDLPKGLSREQAIAWNLSFEEKSGMVIEASGRARYTGRMRELLAAHSKDLAGGFDVKDLEEVHNAWAALRTRLQQTPA